MKILLLSNKRLYDTPELKGCWNVWNEELFREELARTVETVCWGWGYIEDWASVSVADIEKRFGKFDVYLIHFKPSVKDINGFNSVEGIKVYIAPDYYEGNHPIYLDRCNRMLTRYKFDITMGYSYCVVDLLRKNSAGKRQYLLPFTVDTGIFRKMQIIKRFDVSVLFGRDWRNVDRYPMRKKIVDMLINMPIKSFTPLDYSIQSLYYKSILRINESKISINCNSRYKFVNPRVTEVMACGTFLLTDRCEELTKFGYKDGVHLVMFENLEDLKDKILYYLENEVEREEIAHNGMKFVRDNYSHKNRVDMFLNHIRDFKDEPILT